MYSLQICFPVSSFSVRHYCFSVHKNLSHTNTSHCMYHIRLVHESLPSEYILSHIPGRYTVETPPSFRNGKHKKKNTTTVIFFCIYYNVLKNMRRLILYSMAFGCYHISEQFRLISIVYSNYKEFHTVISN